MLLQHVLLQVLTNLTNLRLETCQGLDASHSHLTLYAVTRTRLQRRKAQSCLRKAEKKKKKMMVSCRTLCRELRSASLPLVGDVVESNHFYVVPYASAWWLVHHINKQQRQRQRTTV